MPLHAGQTFFIPSGTVGEHLFVLVLGPLTLPDDFCMGSAEHVLLVNVSTLKEDKPYDGACILDTNDHPFIKHKSYIVYRLMRIERATDFEKKIKMFRCGADCNDALLQKIRKGAIASKFIKSNIKELFLHHL